MVNTPLRPMASILDIQSQIPLLREVQSSLNVARLCGINHIDWVITNSASVLLGVHIARDAGSVRVNRIAAVVGPDRIIDADGVCGVEA